MVNLSSDKPADAPPPVLKAEVRDLSFYYGDFKALKGVSMPVYENKVTALIGPSGCGKSTFLRCFNRMHDLYPGHRYDGKIELYPDNVDLLDAALMSRFMRIDVCAAVAPWAAWARQPENNIHAKIIEYVESVQNALDESQGGSNPRSWTYASRTLTAAGAELLDRSPDTIVTALNGLIGPVHTTALMRLILGTEVPLKPADVVHNWPTSRATMHRWLRQGRLDLLAASMRIILQWVRPEGVAEQLRASARQRGNVRSFFKALPGDLAEQARGCRLELGYTFLIPKEMRGEDGQADGGPGVAK